MNKKTITFVFSDKGGVGKSVLSSVITDYLYASDESVLLAECDNSAPDVAKRFDGIVETVIVSMSRAEDVTNSMIAFAEAMETIEQDHIIVNLPAAAGEALDPLAPELLAPVFEALDREIITAYVISESPDTVRLADYSMRHGLCSISNRKIAVMNGYFGDPGQFPWAASDTRADWLNSGGEEAFLPELHDSVKSLVVGPFSHYVGKHPKDNRLSNVRRILLAKWRDKANATPKLIYDASPKGDVHESVSA
jgi:hypothetical protein